MSHAASVNGRPSQAGAFPPGPPDIGSSTLALYLSYREFLADPLGTVGGWVAEYGDLFHRMSGSRHQYYVLNPDMVREILVRQASNFIKGPEYTSPKGGLARFMGEGLVTSNGAFWRRQRRLVQPAFHTQRISAYADTMVKLALECIGNWRDGQVLDVDQEMMHLTLMIVGRTLFDADTSTTTNQVKRAMDIIQKASNTATLLPHWVPTPQRIRSRRANATLSKIVYGFIDQRRASGEDRGDLLSMLLLSEDEDGQRMTDRQARDEAVTLFLAGHETTANTLNWTFWLLAQNPEVEARLHAELDRELGGSPPQLKDLRRLRYTDWVIKESMRLMPPVWAIARVAAADTDVLGYPFPQQTMVQIPIYFLHRHPEYWSQPEDYLPERWGAPEAKQQHRYAYLPFGGGPRICIGNSFATMEAQLLLSAIAQRFELRLAPGAKVVPQPMITMYPRYGLPMRLTARQPNFAAPVPSPERAIAALP